ncbi:MAG: hypothetical protein AAF310_01175 [Myxococcota bacterium]
MQVVTDSWHCTQTLFAAHKYAVTTAAFGSDDNTLLTGGADGLIKVWKKQNAKEDANNKQTKWQIIKVLKGHEDNVTKVTLSPDGNIIAWASLDETVQLWDAKTGKSLGVLQHEDEVNDLAFYPLDGSLLTTAGADGVVRLWSVNESHKPWQELEKHKAAVNSLVFSSQGDMLVSGGEDDSIVFWTFNSDNVETSDPIQFAHKCTGGDIT